MEDCQVQPSVFELQAKRSGTCWSKNKCASLAMTNHHLNCFSTSSFSRSFAGKLVSHPGYAKVKRLPQCFQWVAPQVVFFREDLPEKTPQKKPSPIF
jgi:hypothetical protein